MGAAARNILHRLVRVRGGCHGPVGVVENASVGAVHPRADRGRGGVPGDVVVPPLPVAEGFTVAAAAAQGYPTAATVGIGGATTDGRPCRLRARVVLPARRDGARPDAPRRRAA